MKSLGTLVVTLLFCTTLFAQEEKESLDNPEKKIEQESLDQESSEQEFGTVQSEEIEVALHSSDSSTVDFVAYWGLRDQYSFEITKTKRSMLMKF